MSEEERTYKEISVVLEGILKTFKEKFKSITEDTLGEIECDFLPFLEHDLELNVPSMTRQAIRDFLEGREVKLFDLSGIGAKDVRRKIFEDNREEILKALAKDIDDAFNPLDCPYNMGPGTCQDCGLGILKEHRGFCPYILAVNRLNQFRLRVREELGRLNKIDEDIARAATELRVKVPQPGTDAARLLIANRLLKDEVERLKKKRNTSDE